jgi:hypothetical protein
MVAIYSAYIVFASPKTGEPVYWKIMTGSRNLGLSKYVVDKPYKGSSVCAMYFRLNKKDDSGFTPETMEWDMENGELSIIGIRESKTIQKKFKVGSFSPRIASLYNSKMRDRDVDENARVRVGEIIVDTEMTQPNIIEYVNSQTDETLEYDERISLIVDNEYND